MIDLSGGRPKRTPAPEWMKESARAGVKTALEGATPEQQHDAWCDHKIADGWVHGPVKDADKKTHPCLVPYAHLPKEQQAKDTLYLAVIRGVVGPKRQPHGT